MISDKKLATKEREIAKLFMGLRFSAHPLAEQSPTTDRVGNTVPSSAQRIEHILRRVENERNDDLHTGDIDIPSRSTEHQIPSS